MSVLQKVVASSANSLPPATAVVLAVMLVGRLVRDDTQHVKPGVYRALWTKGSPS